MKINRINGLQSLIAKKPVKPSRRTFLGRLGSRMLRGLQMLAMVLMIGALAFFMNLQTGYSTSIATQNPGSESGSETSVTETIQTDTLLPAEEDNQDDLIFNRFSSLISQPVVTGSAGTWADEQPFSAFPLEDEPPTPTPYPRFTDAAGIPQEGMPVSDFIAEVTTCYVKVWEANVRELPNTSSAILLTLTKGAKVTRLGHGLDWSIIRTASGKTGYVLSSLITTTVVLKPAPTPRPRPRITPSPVGSTLTSEQKQAIIDLARSLIGIRYRYGYASPTEGFDCSGLTCYIYKTLFRITLPRSAHDQAKAGVAVSRSEIEVGDIICFDWDYPRGVCDHVGIYIGGGHYIHASYSDRTYFSRYGAVKESFLNYETQPVISIRRIIH